MKISLKSLTDDPDLINVLSNYPHWIITLYCIFRLIFKICVNWSHADECRRLRNDEGAGILDEAGQHYISDV